MSEQTNEIKECVVCLNRFYSVNGKIECGACEDSEYGEDACDDYCDY